MIGFLLTLLAVALLMPRLAGAVLRVGALIVLAFAGWVLLHPECQTDACRQALFNYENGVR